MSSLLNSFSALNCADYAIIAIITGSVLISLLRGFVRESISLLTWIIAFFVAFKLSNVFADLLSDHIQTPSIRIIICFASLFIIVLILGALVNFFIAAFVAKTGLGGTDRMLGMIFGILRGVLLVSIMILLGTMTDLVRENWWQHSVLIPYFNSLVSWLHSFLPDKLSGFNDLRQIVA